MADELVEQRDLVIVLAIVGVDGEARDADDGAALVRRQRRGAVPITGLGLTEHGGDDRAELRLVDVHRRA